MSTAASSTAGAGPTRPAPAVIAVEPPRQPEVLRLLDAGTAHARGLYAPEHSFLLDVGKLERPEVRFYVARDAAGAAVGTAALVGGGRTDDGAPRGELKRMFVDPEARGLGVAGALLARIEADALAEGLAEIVLETGDLHHAAQALYVKHGFRPIPQFGQYLGQPHSCCFGKRLDPAS